jgi:hypothetical protein
MADAQKWEYIVREAGRWELVMYSPGQRREWAKETEWAVCLGPGPFQQPMAEMRWGHSEVARDKTPKGWLVGWEVMLDAYGEEGWELVSVQSGRSYGNLVGDVVRLFFKRPRQEPATAEPKAT